MKIQVYFSEQNSSIPKFDKNADILLVIGNGNNLNFKKDSRPIIYLPSVHDYHGEDITTNAKKITRLQPLIDKNINILEQGVYQTSEIRILSAIGWPTFNGMRPDIVTLSLANSSKYEKINAEQWFSNSKNLQLFYQINEKLISYPTYRQVMQEAYEPGKFHPIISNIMGQQTLNWLQDELARPYLGKTIVLMRYAPFTYSLLKYNVLPWPSKKMDFLKVLSKAQDDRFFYNFLNGGKTDFISNKNIFCFHLGLGNMINYRLNLTNVVAALNKNIIVSLDDEKNELYSIQNTLHDIYQNSQLFIKLMQHIVANPIDLIKDAEEYIQMSRLYNFNLLPLLGEYFRTLEAVDSSKLHLINDKELGLTPEETKTGTLNHSLQYYRLKAYNNIIQENDRLIKKWHDFFYDSY